MIDYSAFPWALVASPRCRTRYFQWGFTGAYAGARVAAAVSSSAWTAAPSPAAKAPRATTAPTALPSRALWSRCLFSRTRLAIFSLHFCFSSSFKSLPALQWPAGKAGGSAPSAPPATGVFATAASF